MSNKRNVGVQSYAGWAMMSKPTQTGMDLRFHYPPPFTMTTRIAGPWKVQCKRDCWYQSGVAVQAKVKKVNRITQTPRGGPSAARTRGGPRNSSEGSDACSREELRCVPTVGDSASQEIEVSCEVFPKDSGSKCVMIRVQLPDDSKNSRDHCGMKEDQGKGSSSRLLRPSRTSSHYIEALRAPPRDK